MFTQRSTTFSSRRGSLRRRTGSGRYRSGGGRREGSAAEVAGPDYVARDTSGPPTSYRGDMEAEWRSYATDARRLIEAFLRGVNAQITHVLADPARLPIEFQLAGFGPALDAVNRARTDGGYT